MSVTDVFYRLTILVKALINIKTVFSLHIGFFESRQRNLLKSLFRERMYTLFPKAIPVNKKENTCLPFLRNHRFLIFTMDFFMDFFVVPVYLVYFGSELPTIIHLLSI